MTLNTSKATIALVALVCITVLLVTNSISSDAGFGLLGTLVGYAVGNGVGAKTGTTIEPIIKPRQTNKT